MQTEVFEYIEKHKGNRVGAEIFEYIKKHKGGRVNKVGVILGTKVDGVIKIGWSKCNIDKDDFSASEGIKLARSRAIKGCVESLPKCIKNQYRQFGCRCLRYFKDANKIEMQM